MKVNSVQDISNVQDFEQLRRFSARLFKQISEILNGEVNFTDNFRASIAEVEFTAANTEQRITHGLGKAPIGYIAIGKSANMNLYDGETDTTQTEIYIQSSATGTAKILIF